MTKWVRVTRATNKGSGEPVHKRSPARAFVFRRYVVLSLRKLQIKSDMSRVTEEAWTGKLKNALFRMSAHILYVY